MAQERRTIEEIAAALPTGALWQQLPERIGSYRLRRLGTREGQILSLALYEDPAAHRGLRLIYSQETGDYVPVKEVGLHRFQADEYFTRDGEEFARTILPALPRLLQDLAGREDGGYEARELRLEEWAYWRQLPRQVGGFSLFITPRRPLPFINGSTIFLDYSDFARGHQLYLLYNAFRDELFAEYRRGFVPLASLARHELNGPEGSPPLHSLGELEERLQAQLLPALEELAQE